MNILSLISPWLDIICQVITKCATIPKSTIFHQLNRTFVDMFLQRKTEINNAIFHSSLWPDEAACFIEFQTIFIRSFIHFVLILLFFRSIYCSHLTQHLPTRELRPTTYPPEKTVHVQDTVEIGPPAPKKKLRKYPDENHGRASARTHDRPLVPLEC